MPAFTEILNLSISASVLVLALIAARWLFLRRAPKALRCALWALVAIRLLLPFSIESRISLQPSREIIPEQYLTTEPIEYNAPARLDLVTNPVYEVPITIETEATVDRLQNWDMLASVVWLAGMGAMGIYAAYSYLSLRLRVRMAAWVRENIYECDELDTPFILGLLRPRIYLPSDLDEITRSHVLAHEQAHLKRLDHLWKPLGFFLLTVHWFNPVLWAAYVLLCRDIELACDEKVIRSLEKPQIRTYSEALVRCSVTRRSIALCPLAFGEVGVKSRIRTILSYKKPAFWVLVTGAVCTLILSACFLTDPARIDPEEHPDVFTLEQILNQEGVTITDESMCAITLRLNKRDLPEDVLNGKEHFFEPEQITVWSSEETLIWLESARMRGNGLSLTFTFSHTLPAEGTIFLNTSVLDRDDLLDLEEKTDGLRTDAEYYPDSCHVYSSGGSSFSMHVDMGVYKQLTGTFYLDLKNCWRVDYRSSQLPPLTTGDILSAIVQEEGYSITASAKQEAGLMFYIDWLPEKAFEPEGYTFRAGELNLIDTGTTFLDVARIVPEGDKLRFDFRMRYILPESGTILLPYHITAAGPSYDLTLGSRIHDYSRSYPDGVELVPAFEGETFSLRIDRAMVENADDYLSIDLEGFYETTYVPDGTAFQGKYLHVEQTLYRHPDHTLEGSAAFAPAYIALDTMHLTALEQGSRWEIRRDLGEMGIVQLTKEQFDDLFVRRYKTTDFSPETIRKNTLRAWICHSQSMSHLLLQQHDGTLYLAVMREQGAVITDFYRLSAGDPTGASPLPMSRSYAMHIPDALDVPNFTLFTDGTFKMTTSVLSSYLGLGSYTLEEDALVLTTADGRYTWTFVPDGSDFVYDSSRSAPITCYPDLKTAWPIPDGTRFCSGTRQEQQPQTYEEHLSQAIIEHNRTAADSGLICVESHEVLGELIACGAATVDGSPVEIITAYLAGAYEATSPNGEHMYLTRANQFCAAITLELTADGWTVTGYEQTPYSENEAEAIFPEHILEKFAERFDLILSDANRENTVKTRLFRCSALGLETDVEKLLDTICSSPAAASNPGAYIDAHRAEFDRLVLLEDHTLRYCFTQFAAGGQTDLRGHIMALACQKILAENHPDPIENCLTGQDWFDRFALEALAVQQELSRKPTEFEQKHPYCFLLLSILEP